MNRGENLFLNEVIVLFYGICKKWGRWKNVFKMFLFVYFLIIMVIENLIGKNVR